MLSEDICRSCFIKQMENEIRNGGPSYDLAYAMVEVMVREMTGAFTPVEIACEIHRSLRGIGVPEDPYIDLKRDSNERARSMTGWANEAIGSSDDPERTALMMATAANVVDYGARNLFDLEEMLQKSLRTGLTLDQTGEFLESLAGARVLNVISDNSGECVFDALMMTRLRYGRPDLRVNYWVKSAPLLNDVTRKDAIECGIAEDDLVSIVELPHPGWITPEDVRSMEGIVLSKGQGNYESLSDTEGVFFSLAVKCEVVARSIGVDVGDLVFFGK